MLPSRHSWVSQPRLRHDDYTRLAAPRLGEWQPTLSVSVLVPAGGAGEWLDVVLAALGAQGYPRHLFEVVVVEPGDAPRVDADVILRLAPALLPAPDHLEAHLRWHHLADYLVVTGASRPAGTDLHPADVLEAVAVGKTVELFDPTPASDVVVPGYATASGAVSFSNRLYRDCGGADPLLPAGGEIELGYRLAQAGAVFVAEPEARAWRLTAPEPTPGPPARYGEQVLRHRVPVRRDLRTAPGRDWLVPFVDIVVEVNGRPYPDVVATVNGALGGTVSDVRVSLVGPWPDLPAAAPAEPRLADLWLIREEFAADGRVRLVESVEATSAPAPYRFVCPPGLALGSDALRLLIEQADQAGLGWLMLAVARGTELAIARLERTQAVARALALREPDEDLGDVVDELFGVHWIDGAEWALRTPAQAAKAAMTTPHLIASVERLEEDVARRKNERAKLKEDVQRWRQLAQMPWQTRLAAGAKRRLDRLRRQGKRADGTP